MKGKSEPNKRMLPAEDMFHLPWKRAVAYDNMSLEGLEASKKVVQREMDYITTRIKRKKAGVK